MGGKAIDAEVNYSLKFYHAVLGLDHLHYGLWNGEATTFENLKLAQIRYTDVLIQWIPAGVQRVLDVGCGTGATALRLSKAGFDVVALTPDSYQKRIFEERTSLPCRLARFEDLDSDERFDLVLMSESCQYIQRPAIFEKLRQVCSGGYLLIADYFVLHNDGTPSTEGCHPLAEFLEDAASRGFVLEREENITEQVLPTLEFARALVDDHIVPGVELGRDVVTEKHPMLFKLGRWLMRKQIAKFQVRRGYLDSDDFRHKKQYMRLLYRVPS
ncbi:MAG: methyltransferase domain-containing protein [Alphaproteobacteria bacterium]|nr:methyltransferase domain-containing protein [Alphaproteobacteria bacterium]